MVVIEIGGQRAIIVGRQWQCDREVIRAILQSDADITDLPAADPFPDLTIAQVAVKAYGGRVIEQTLPAADKGVIY